jgi:putative Holliday junction resolvase
MSFLGLDIGNKKIGLAIGTVFADEYETLIVKPPADSFFDGPGVDQLILALNNIINKEKIEALVVGLPVNENNSEGPQAKKVRQLIEKLKNSIDLPIHLEDEFLTSFAAEEMLKEEGLTIKEAKLRVDQVSAKLILQQFLEKS